MQQNRYRIVQYFSFFIARFSVRVAGAAARDQARAYERGVQGVHCTRLRGPGRAGVRVKFWCRTQWRINGTKFQ